MISILSFFGCALLKPLPKPKGALERLSDFPTEGLPLRENVTVYWDDHLIPFIEAKNDDDLAVTLGMVHAHLRLAQMELYRRAAAGRSAEMFGPYFTKIDHSIRILGLYRAAEAVEKALPPSHPKMDRRLREGHQLLRRPGRNPPP